MDAMKRLLEQHGISGSANDFLVLLWGIIQFFDDVYDGDSVQEFNRVLFGVLINLPCNTFYLQHREALAPAIHVAIEKWMLANAQESAKLGDARSYMWRAGYWDIVALVCSITGNNAGVASALELYDESFEEYLQEVNHAGV